MDGYATHLAALVGALTYLRPGEGVLELGCGDYSTPLLAEFCNRTGRAFRVMASDEQWAEQFDNIAFVKRVDWQTVDFGGPWGLVLLDNEENTGKRLGHLPVLAKCARMVVLHDADAAMNRPHWGQSIKPFARVEVFNRYKPWTALLHA